MNSFYSYCKGITVLTAYSTTCGEIITNIGKCLTLKLIYSKDN